MSIQYADLVKKILPDATKITEVKVGGQKAVYCVNGCQHGAVVAKIILPSCSDSRLIREIEIVSGNDFPNVPKIIKNGYIDAEGTKFLYIIEPYIDGCDLRGVLNQDGKLSLPETINLLSCLLETVAALEQKDVVHRDIKPENILRSTTGKYWLIDFGIARDLHAISLTATGAHFGPHTAGYAAPEQIRNMKKKIDSKADLFSIGVVAYEVLTGRHPFSSGARDYLEVLRRTETLQVDRLKIEGDNHDNLSNFVHVMMEKYPSRRPPSVKLAKDWFQQITRSGIGGAG